MAPTWIQEFQAVDGALVGQVFHPGHVEALAVVERDARWWAVAAGINNRLGPSPIVVEIPLPLATGQLAPGCGEGLAPVEARMWRIEPATFRFDEVQAVPDGTGTVYLHGADRAQRECWALWHLGGDLRSRSVAEGCSPVPVAIAVGERDGQCP